MFLVWDEIVAVNSPTGIATEMLTAINYQQFFSMKKLSKNFYNYLDIYIILGTGIISISAYFISKEKLDIPIAIFGIGISIAFSLRQYRIENDKIFKELFVMYNDKYDKNFNNCLNEIAAKTEIKSDLELEEKEIQIVTDYLNMCAEEYLWYTKGRIDKSVWNSWERGMKYYLTIPSIRQVIQQERKQEDSYYGIFQYLKL